MFSRVNQIIFGGLTAVIWGLGAWSWRQSSKIDSLQATNQTQAQTILQLEQNQERLNQQLQAEQQAVEKQQKIANELKAKSEQSLEKVQVILQKEPYAYHNTHSYQLLYVYSLACDRLWVFLLAYSPICYM